MAFREEIKAAAPFTFTDGMDHFGPTDVSIGKEKKILRNWINEKLERSFRIKD